MKLGINPLTPLQEMIKEEPGKEVMFEITALDSSKKLNLNEEEDEAL